MEFFCRKIRQKLNEKRQIMFEFSFSLKRKYFTSSRTSFGIKKSHEILFLRTINVIECHTAIKEKVKIYLTRQIKHYENENKTNEKETMHTKLRRFNIQK